ncbi:MAG: hypothetical protein AAFQ14_05135 [Cyanobacteria bacterium J06621_12]
MITFDFDDTLTRPIWDKKGLWFEPSSNPNYDSFARLKSFHDRGEEIRIVTTRFKTRWSRLEIVDFIEKYQLPISAIHCTEGELKGETLFELGSRLHFDDSPSEAENNLKYIIPTMVVSYRFDPAELAEICEFELVQ